MLNTNLASRPFYNERAVQLAVGAIAVIVLAFTLFNAIELASLSARQTRLGSHAADGEREADRLRVDAARIRTQIDPKELQTVSVAAREANGIIDQRAFSWTDLFAQFEATLPPDVRIKAVQPRLDKGMFLVAVVVQARTATELNHFIEALEGTGAFRNVKPAEVSQKEGGLLEAVVDAVYAAPARGAPEAKK